MLNKFHLALYRILNPIAIPTQLPITMLNKFHLALYRILNLTNLTLSILLPSYPQLNHSPRTQLIHPPIAFPTLPPHESKVNIVTHSNFASIETPKIIIGFNFEANQHLDGNLWWISSLNIKHPWHLVLIFANLKCLGWQTLVLSLKKIWVWGS